MSDTVGEGRVHKCLWDNKDKISKACRAEEIKIQIMQSSNTELMPNLAKACKAERGAHCKGVRPGKSRVYNCLLTNSDSVDFTEACKEQLMGQQAKRVRDYRMDYDLRIGCKNDVPKVILYGPSSLFWAVLDTSEWIVIIKASNAMCSWK